MSLKLDRGEKASIFLVRSLVRGWWTYRTENKKCSAGIYLVGTGRSLFFFSPRKKQLPTSTSACINYSHFHVFYNIRNEMKRFGFKRSETMSAKQRLKLKIRRNDGFGFKIRTNNGFYFKIRRNGGFKFKIRRNNGFDSKI